MTHAAFVAWNPGRKNSPGWLIDPKTGCHLWTGGRSTSGYGRVSINRRMVSVHRVRYEREIGPVPEGMDLDHFVCENRGCCNPQHVRPATRRENLLRGRGVVAENASKTHCPQGHPLSGPNLIVRRGWRECRTCKRARDRARYTRTKKAS